MCIVYFPAGFLRHHFKTFPPTAQRFHTEPSDVPWANSCPYLPCIVSGMRVFTYLFRQEISSILFSAIFEPRKICEASSHLGFSRRAHVLRDIYRLRAASLLGLARERREPREKASGACFRDSAARGRDPKRGIYRALLSLLARGKKIPRCTGTQKNGNENKLPPPLLFLL